MPEKHLHIITHDVPYPADFGGVVDLFYKIRTLARQGVQLYLHCFHHQRPPQDALLEYCVEVNYYPRQKNPQQLSWRLPFIVNSRKSADLLKRLKQDDHPILMEGIHCTHILQDAAIRRRHLLLRLHNVEHIYYQHLAKLETHPFRKFYYWNESRLLKRYERQIAKLVPIISVSEQDKAYYQREFAAEKIWHVPVFIPFTHAEGKPGRGFYCLYHGNLSINENEKAVSWLLREVFRDLEIPFVVTGKDPSQQLELLAHQKQHTCLVANPSDKELQDMISKAQVHILPSLNNTGVKLKLLNALYNGRHCLVNQAGAAGSGLESLCHFADDAESFRQAIQYLYDAPYETSDNERRDEILRTSYNNERNAKWLMEYFWS